MSDVPTWFDIVAAFGSVPKDHARNLVMEYVRSVIECESISGPLGKNTYKFLNVVVKDICWILAMASLEKDDPRELNEVSLFEELFGINNISALPFDVNNIVVQFKTLFESESTMEPSEYEAKLAVLQRELIEKLVKDMLAGPYFKEVFDRLVVTAN